MRVITGIGVGRGAVVGPVARAHPVPQVPKDAPAPADPEAAAEQLAAVFGDVAQDLQARADAAAGTLKDVLGATALMAKDPALSGQVLAKVRAGTAPSLAVHQVVGQFIEMFTAAGGYMAERATDLASVRDRVIARVEGLPEPGVPALARPSVVVAEDLSPGRHGGARPVSGARHRHREGWLDEPHGDHRRPAGPAVRGAGDGGRRAGRRRRGGGGRRPRDRDGRRRTTTSRRPWWPGARRSRRSPRTPPTAATADGHGVQLLANIGTAEDAERLTDAAVQGVGLFRTEVLFLDAQTAPTEDDQAAVYARALTRARRPQGGDPHARRGGGQAAGVRDPAR